MKTKMVAMLAVAAALVVHADTEYVAGMGWDYQIVDGKTATITGTDSWLAGTVTVPSKLGGKPVAAIGERAFKGRNIIGVTIPASVTGICDSAFMDCSKLRAVKIPDSVVFIGASAFSGCSSLVCADIGKKMNAIGELAFEYCWYLDALVFRGNAPADVSDSAFTDLEGCSAYVAKSAKGWPAAGENWKGLPVVVGDRMVNVSADIDHYNDLGEVCGTVSGNGEYAVGKKVTLKATPAKNCVFGGWVEHGQNEVISYSKSFAYTVDGYHYGDTPQFTARFKKIVEPEDDVLFLQVGNTYAWYGYVDLPLRNIVRTFSEPKFTFKGLPSGAKYDAKTLKLAGQVKVPGKYKVEISVSNVSNKQPLSNSFIVEVPNYTDSAIKPLRDSYGTFIPGVPVEPFTIAGGAGCKVTGLPPGMKWTDKDIMKKGTTEVEVPANSYYGTPTKPGNYTVFFSKTTADKRKHEATATFKVGPFPKLTLVMSGNSGNDKVSGEGEYAASAKVSLKATADKGKVFSHWEEVPSGKILSYAAKFTYEMNPADTTLRGVFIAEDEDKLTSTSVGAFAFEGDTVSAAGTIPAGVYLEWPIAVDATSLPTVKVSGLPTGLKFTAKDVVDSKTKAVLVPANTIYGVPTAASKADGDGKPIPSDIKVTVTTVSKKTAAYTIAVTVKALPEWAVGTFDGGGSLGPATLTISSAGKISGKYLSEGLTWTLSAASFDSYDEAKDEYTVAVAAKSGKDELSETIVLGSSGSDVVGGMAIASGDFGAITFVQTNWKVEPWKSIGGKIANKTFELVGTAGDLPTDEDKVTFKFAANGSVAAKGEFAAYGSTYSASASFAVIPLNEPKGEAQEFECAVVIYFPPKANKFDGFAGYTRLSWDGEKFVRCLAD